ncbi:MAG: hypothetical protein K6B52_09660 [Clostridiales bacterium]|nr:hypothetical protein [Clostridiales bacterium]
MRKTLSVILATLMILTAVMCVPAYAAGIDGTLITEADAKQAAADYLGTTSENFSKYSCSAETVEYVSVGTIIKVTATQYNLSFRYNGVSYKVTVDPVGVIRNFSYSSNKLLIPKGASGIITEAEARAKATDAAGVSSSEAIFTGSKFIVEEYVMYYSFEFLGKTKVVSARVNAVSKSATPVLSITEKSAFVMMFIRLFAKISMLFG